MNFEHFKAHTKKKHTTEYFQAKVTHASSLYGGPYKPGTSHSRPHSFTRQSIFSPFTPTGEGCSDDGGLVCIKA